MCIRDRSYSGRLGLATLEQKEGKFREALEILNKMLAATPEDATLYIARADEMCIRDRVRMSLRKWQEYMPTEITKIIFTVMICFPNALAVNCLLYTSRCV